MSSGIKKYTSLIIEDELLATMRMRRLLNAHQNTIELIGTANTGQAAIDMIQSETPDLIFLDIQLPDMSGLDILDQIDHNPMIIFTTAYSEFAVQAFEKHAIDYLVKPIAQERFDLAIAKLDTRQTFGQLDMDLLKSILVGNTSAKKITSLPIKKKDKIILIAFEDIVFFKADDKYLNVHTKDGSCHLISKSLSELETGLPDQFTRVHRSYIINRIYVREIHKHFKGKFILQLSDRLGSKIQTGSSYKENVKLVFGL